MQFFDAHTHTQFAAFKDDWKKVIDRALAKNVWLINVGTQKDTSRRAVEIAKEYPQGVYAAVGLHPIHTEKSYHDSQELGLFSSSQEHENKGFVGRGEEFDYGYYKELAQDSKVVAIGECGLDYYRLGGETPSTSSGQAKEKQKRAFEAQIQLACDLKKPLMIHCRQAFDDLIEILKANSSKLKAEEPGVIHFFTGTKEDAAALLDMGFYFTFGGVITFTRDYDEAVKFIPLDRILSETDAPYVAPAPYRGKPRHQIEHSSAQPFSSHQDQELAKTGFAVNPGLATGGDRKTEVLGSVRGKRNEPAYVVEVVKKLAEIKNVSFGEMTEKIFTNTKALFKI